MRAFIAIDIPDEVVAQAQSVQRQLKRRASDNGIKASWVPAANMHVTLVFLGDISEERAAALSAALAQRLAAHSSFDVKLGQLGAFPNRRRPRTLWLGLGDGNDCLRALHDDVTSTLLTLGMAVERRRFHAHITLARVRSSPADWIEDIDPPTAVTVRVEEVVLYESALSASGARYRALSRCPLHTEPEA